MDCKKGDYLCIAGNYYCLKPGQECTHRDYTRVKEIQIQDSTGRTDQAYNGCNLTTLIEQEQRRTTARFHTIR